jgi:dienelactone hydrolase
MRKWVLLVTAVALLALVAAPGAALAAPSITDALTCADYGDDAMTVCSGEVPSFDGSKLDVDLTLPAQGSTGPHPLIVMLHGFGNNKHEWESTTDEGDGADKYHWNSHWFSRHGYYVLTYTARGFCRRPDECEAYEDYQPPTPGGTSAELPNGTLHLKSREFEVRDTQWLAALVAAGYDVDPQEIAVTGGSYGGGESWLQAAQPQWTFPHEQDPSLPVLDLQVAVPKYPWTDLSYALAPNGHGPDIYASAQQGNPIGTVKASYVSALFALGNAEGLFEEGTTVLPPAIWQEGPINVPAWNARAVGQGDPYDVAGAEDPVVTQLRRGLTEFRSSYYQPWAAQEGGRKVAVFAIQGWTDDLFPAVEATRQFKQLKALDPRWPVEIAIADVGHSRAQNKPEVWHHLNNQANQWLESNIGGSTDQQTNVSSLPSTCPNDPGGDTEIRAISATTPEGLSGGTLRVEYARGGQLANPLGVLDPNGPATDPVVGDIISAGEPCRSSDAPAAGGYTAVSVPLRDNTTYVGLGEATVPYTLQGATTATVHARVWDVGEDRTLLVTRGTYRIDVPAYDTPAGTLRLPLFGNHWKLRRGHRVRLDLTQVDNATFRASNLPSSMTFGPPRLTLPTRESGDRTIPGS